MTANDLTRPSGDQLADEYRPSRLRTTALLDGISANDDGDIERTAGPRAQSAPQLQHHRVEETHP